MKIVCINGSPHKTGNTATMIKTFADTTTNLCADVSTIHLNTLNYKGCQGCMMCKGKLAFCVLKDDLTEVLAKTKEAVVLVMGSPIYFGEVTSQLKGFIDRTFSFLNPGFTDSKTPSRLKPGKTLVMMLPQGAPDEKSFGDVFSRYAGFFRWFGYEKQYEIRGCGMGDPEDAGKNTDLLNQVKDIARKITEK
ncbi:flavodoxin family protein [bacterium]|nr:flavodoxin family protein [bacterium]